MDKVKTVVSIAGKDYTICGEESAEYIHRVALRVNQKMGEIKKNNLAVSNVQLSMLTSINLADELIKAEDLLAEQKKEMDSLKAELERMRKFPNQKFNR